MDISDAFLGNLTKVDMTSRRSISRGCKDPLVNGAPVLQRQLWRSLPLFCATLMLVCGIPAVSASDAGSLKAGDRRSAALPGSAASLEAGAPPALPGGASAGASENSSITSASDTEQSTDKLKVASREPKPKSNEPPESDQSVKNRFEADTKAVRTARAVKYDADCRAAKGDKDKGSDRSGDKKTTRRSHKNVTSMLTWVDPEKEPRAALLCVHGLGLYNNTYAEFGKAMSAKGYVVFAMDVPGFGSFQNIKTDEAKKKIDFDVCLEDMAITIGLIRKAYPKLPIFILGESMGGAIVLRFTSLHPEMVDGMISSVPSGDRFKQNKEKLRVGIMLLKSPNKQFDVGSDVIERATEKEDLKKSWSGDPLNRMNLSAKDLVQFQSFMNENHDSAKLIKNTPVLFVQGCKDKLVRPEGTVSLFNRLGCSDKQLELIHDAEHLIFEEGQFDDHVVRLVDTWLSNHLKTSKQITSK